MTWSDSSRSSSVSPIPIRIPVVNGIESLPAFSIISIRTAGSFPGEFLCAGISAVVSSISPMLAFTSRRRSSLFVGEDACVGMREKPPLDGRKGEVVDIVEDIRVTESCKFRGKARHRAGPFPEGEEGFRAAQGGTRIQGPDHFVGGHDASLLDRGPETAVAAAVGADGR